MSQSFIALFRLHWLKVFFAILVVLLTIFGGLIANTNRPPHTTSPISIYPYPDSPISSPNSYPFPSESQPAANTDEICKGCGEWLTYTNETAGFSLQYPAESILRLPQTGALIVLKPFCHQPNSGGYVYVSVYAYENPNGLEVTEFVCQNFLENSPKACSNSASSWWEKLFSGERFLSVDGERSWWLSAGVTPRSQPDIFIPHREWIIRLWIGPHGKGAMMPPFTKPSRKALALLQQMVASIEWIEEIR
jgi:hypothetical protein